MSGYIDLFHCPDCKKKKAKGVLFSMPASKLESFLGIYKFKCNICHQSFAYKYGEIIT